MSINKFLSIKISLLFSIIFLVGVGVGYYYALIILAHEENTKNITEVLNRYEEVMKNTQVIIKNQKRQDEFLLALKTVFQKNGYHLNAIDLLKPLENIAEAKKDNVPTHHVFKNINTQELEYLLKDMESSDANLRKKSLVALALLGSPERKQDIEAVIQNKDEDPALRMELIKAMDWSNASSDLIKIIETSDSPDIKATAIESAQTAQFSNEERQGFDKYLEENIAKEGDDFVKINTLNYFANTDNQRLLDIIESLPKEHISPTLQEHIDFIINPRAEGGG